MMLRNLAVKSVVRPFSTSSIAFKGANSSSEKKPLYLRPQDWIGLHHEQIWELYQLRQFNLGDKYRKDKRECEALMSIAAHFGQKPQDMERIYYEEAPAAAEITDTPLNASPFDVQEEFDEYPEIAQMKVEAHRQRRHINRVTAYEMPHLVKYRQEYTPPKNQPISFKYTKYMGEEDLPANRRVVMTAKSSELGLSGKSLHTLRLLAGVRYDYRTDEIKMASERFPERFQNTRYLADTLKKLITEAKENADKFEDIPLDKRHIYSKERKRKNKIDDVKQLKFPQEWNRPEDAPPKKEKTVVDYLTELHKKKALNLL